jgi:hypothetical protein
MNIEEQTDKLNNMVAKLALKTKDLNQTREIVIREGFKEERLEKEIKELREQIRIVMLDLNKELDMTVNGGGE